MFINVFGWRRWLHVGNDRTHLPDLFQCASLALANTKWLSLNDSWLILLMSRVTSEVVLKGTNTALVIITVSVLQVQMFWMLLPAALRGPTKSPLHIQKFPMFHLRLASVDPSSPSRSAPPWLICLSKDTRSKGLPPSSCNFSPKSVWN